jgi:putative 4-mercaptohistidine N1-methyltranferase
VLFGQYCEFHYGGSYFGVENYPARCARLCVNYLPAERRLRALDLGCAVGRTTFELAKAFQYVEGVDLSRRFIGAAETLREGGWIEYCLCEQGELARSCRVSLASLQLEAAFNRVAFSQGDACRLASSYKDYDLVFAGNLIDRLYAPGKFLTAMRRVVRQGGVLVISSPYTFTQEFTPRSHWIGGFEKNGIPVTALDGMKKVLQDTFELVEPPKDIEFVIRETQRKFQHTIAQLTAWQRKY